MYPTLSVVPSAPLPRLVEPKSYERSTTHWTGPQITIISASDQPIAHIPIRFVIQGGNNTWAYVIQVARELVIENDGWIFANGQAVDAADPPMTGTFVYSSPSGNAVRYAAGPSYTTPYKPADVDGSQSQGSRSVATTPKNQASFRETVRMRDIFCTVTETFYNRCEAAHIVPQSRPDVFRAILGLRESEPVNEMYEASAGLLLRNDIHKMFDNLDLSLWHQDGILYVHVFRDVSLFEYHGKAIPPARFHIPYDTYWPKPEYLRWHYRQCLMTRFRGFSA